MKQTIAVATCAVLLAIGAGSAQAAPGYCLGGTATEGISVSNMTFRGFNADDCFGVVLGNDNAAAINTISNWADPLNPWVSLVKIDAPATSNSGSFLGFNFLLSASNFNPATSSGSFSLSWSDPNGPAAPNFPVTLDFVGVLKGGPEFAAYLFDSEVLQAAPNSGAGTWEIVFTNPRGKIPAISHMELYVREGGGGGNQAPEPGTLALLGLALAGMGAMRRRFF